MFEIRKKLALACRILYMEGLGDFHLGHMSSRVPGQNHFYMKPAGLGLEEIKPEDLIVMDMEGNKLEGIHPPHGETPIHSEIYKVRKDVQSVVHVHPPFSTAFSCVRLEMKPLTQDGTAFPQGITTFEDPSLITRKEQGEALAKTLGEERAVLLRNHGIVTVGESIEEACLNAISLEKALKTQSMASQIGKIEPIPEETVWDMFRKVNQNPKRSEDIWNYLVRKLKREGLAFD
jgi:L-ribulose-5-phosphate 4-epimerase